MTCAANRGTVGSFLLDGTCESGLLSSERESDTNEVSVFRHQWVGRGHQELMVKSGICTDGSLRGHGHLQMSGLRTLGFWNHLERVAQHL